MSTRRWEGDAVVVGSGAAGGWAAKVLSEAGLKVLVLEAGPDVPPDRGQVEPLRMSRRLLHYASGKRRMQSFHPAYWASNPDYFIDDRTEPFTTPAGKPFNWIRARQLGGRTLLWGGVTLRMSDYELKAGTREGLGADWPISYADLAPFYDRVERALGIYGTTEMLPQLPDGRYLGAQPLTAAELKLKHAVESAWPDRRVIPCRGLDGSTAPTAGTRWPRLTSRGSTLADAIRTGRTEIRASSTVISLIMEPGESRAHGVLYVDGDTGAHVEARGRLVVLCASTIATVLILLRTAWMFPTSALAELPALGRYLMDHVCTSEIFSLEDVPFRRPPPRTGAHGFLIPRFANLGGDKRSFRGGYGVWGAIQRKGFSGRRGSRTAVGLLVGHGDMEPRYENRVSLGDGRAPSGLPVPDIDCGHSANDRRLHAAMRSDIAEMLESAGGRVRKYFAPFDFPGPWRMAVRLEQQWKDPPPGSYSHEVGGARMGKEPGSSVVDDRNRLWGAPNVLVTDGSCWPTAGWQNPTLTIMAISHRACSLALDSMRTGDL